LLAVIATGVVLTALRGGPLFDFTAGSFSLGSAGGADLIGLLVCAACLLTALRLSKWLTGGKDADPPANAPPSDEEAGPT
jgi:hypothetical protein